MSDHIDTRDGWREIHGEMLHEGQDVLVLRTQGDLASGRFWVREEPVAPLPTEENTLVFARFGENSADEIVLMSDGWRFLGDLISDDSRRHVTGFEVLAVPVSDTEYQAGHRQGQVDAANGEWRRDVIPFESDNSFESRVRRETAKAVLDRVRHLHGPGVAWDEAIAAVAREFGVDS